MFFRVVLDRRLGMYNQALRVAPLETAAELYRSVMESHHRWEFCVNRDLFFLISLLRNYFLSFGFFFLCIIFGFGLCFGRVTRRYLFLVSSGCRWETRKHVKNLWGGGLWRFCMNSRIFHSSNMFLSRLNGEMKNRWVAQEILSSPPSLRKVWRLSWNRPTRPFCKWNWPSSEKWPFLTDSVPICP